MRTLRITVRAPEGTILVSAPLRASMASVRAFVEAKRDWIVKHRDAMLARPIAPPLEYVTGDLIPLEGEHYPLRVSHSTRKPVVELAGGVIHLLIRSTAAREKREKAIQDWYREVLMDAIPPLLAKWEPIMGVRSLSFSLRRMKSMWGSCNTRDRTVRFNTELATKPPECLEYVVVHELVHLLERSHNARFKALMDRFLPDWRYSKALLNQSAGAGVAKRE